MQPPQKLKIVTLETPNANLRRLVNQDSKVLANSTKNKVSGGSFAKEMAASRSILDTFGRPSITSQEKMKE